MLPWFALLGASAAAFLAFRVSADWDASIEFASPIGHFWLVSIAALTCLALALAAGVAAFRAESARVLMLALSFLSMAGLFTVHGLATPGVLVNSSYVGSYNAAAHLGGAGGAAPAGGGYGAPSAPAATPVAAAPSTSEAVAEPPRNPLPAVWLFNLTGLSARLAVVVSVLFLTASTLTWPARVEQAIVRWRALILATVGAGLIAYGLIGLLRPELVPARLVGSVTLAWMTLVLVVVLGTVSAARYAAGFARTGQVMFGTVAVGAAFLVLAQFSLHFGNIWHGTFWLYHLQLIAGFFAILWGVVIEYSRGRTLQSFANLAITDAVEQLRGGLAEPILLLAAALEARDGYTRGHGERVAAMSVLIGEQMRLTPARLRGLAAGALLHDVGKIGVPDVVLHKPGRLDEQEFAIIREHPTRGWEILRYAYGSDVESQVVRYHHEKFDGSGYPDGLSGEAIPLEARIAAVADVYDALRSTRSYRVPMTPDGAAEEIQRSAGSHFDPAVVQAFLEVRARWEDAYADAETPYLERRELTA